MSLAVTREQILAFRRRVSALDVRLPAGADSLRQAAWAGLQDSMPRAALLSIHARVEGTRPDTWDDESLVQTWGPRYSLYAVAAIDLPIFTLSRLPDDERGRQRAEDMADRIEAFLAGRRMPDREVQAGLGIGNAIRYAAPTGRIVIHWPGALAPTIWTVPRPQMSVTDARRELARRYVHVFGPATSASFATWAGISARAAAATFALLEKDLHRVLTPIGEGWLLAEDVPLLSAPPLPPAPARLLPSGDTFYLLQDRDRELLLPSPDQQRALWTSRVWPGALLVGGEIVGTWRRANELLTIELFRALNATQRAAVEEEAASLPLPGLTRPISVAWP